MAFEEMAQRAENAADDAEESASHYPKIENGYWYVWSPEQEQYVSTEVEARGPIGETGAPGFSPIVTVTDITNGHRVDITDENGTHTFDVMDGTTGDAGFSPIIEVSSITGGHRVTITDDDGTHAFDVMDGDTGDTGATFTPTVADDGTLSWTNDKGLPNPESKNIRGPEGPQGIIGMRGLPGYTYTPVISQDGTISWTVNGPLNVPDPVNVRGTTFIPTVSNAGVISWENDGGKTNPQQVNIKGPAGTNGVNGVTFTPEVSSTGVISWTNDGGRLNPQAVNIKGTDGDDGISPTVSVTDITGGHRVTITDADGAHVFDVLDGAPGSGATIHICAPNEYDATTRVPTVQDPEENVFYLVPVADGASSDMFVEWIYANGAWELFGSASVDLSGYQTKITASGLLKGNGNGGVTSATAGTDYGTYSKPSGGIPSTDMTEAVQTSLGKADTALQSAVTDVHVNSVSVLTDGVANVPVGGTSNFGVFKVDATYGISSANGVIRTSAASNLGVKNGSNGWNPIVPSTQHAAAFYGLAKAAGDTTQSQSSNAVGTYTEDAKSAISTMLNGAVSISGSTPSITAKAGVRYICGEVATLDITLPASGIVDVVFQSGSTPTVLTITPPTGVTVKWANGFDPIALDANTTYEINIADGLGVAVRWT